MRATDPALLSLGLILTIGAGAACSGNSGSLREANEEDLSRLVLQVADAPSGFRLSHGENEGLGLQKPGESGASAGYSVQYELSADSAAAGDLACIVSSSSLFGSLGKAEDALREVETAADEAGFERVGPPKIGDAEVIAYRAKSESAVFCSGYENVPAESYYVGFALSNTLGVVAITYLEEGDGETQASQYAQRQAATVRDVLE